VAETERARSANLSVEMRLPIGTEDVQLLNFARPEQVGRRFRLASAKSYYFPFPRLVGRILLHNEFVSGCRKQA
jgi:hypothetical protein